MGQLYFVPANDITNIKILLDAGDITGLNDGDTVATWSDSGPNSLDASQDDGTPIYKTNIINGEPVVRFDGNDSFDAGVASDWKFLHDGSSYTVIIVAYLSQADPGNQQMMISTAWTTDEVGVRMYYYDSGSPENRIFHHIMDGPGLPVYDLDIRTGNVFPPQTTNILFVTVEKGRGGDDGRVYVDNTEYLDTGGGTPEFGSPSTSDPAHALHIGCRPKSPADLFFVGDIPFVCITTDLKGSSDLTDIYNYLGIRYGKITEPTHQPTLSSPADSATDVSVNVTLSWSDESSNGATKYYLQVSTASDFLSGMIYDDEVVSNSKDMTGLLSNGTTYYWRAKSRDDVWESDYTTSRQFTTESGAPVMPPDKPRSSLNTLLRM